MKGEKPRIDEYCLAEELPTKPYWMEEHIYKTYPFIVQTVQKPVFNKLNVMSKMPEILCKDAECTFEDLPGKLQILTRPVPAVTQAGMQDMMFRCVIFDKVILKHCELFDGVFGRVVCVEARGVMHVAE